MLEQLVPTIVEVISNATIAEIGIFFAVVFVSFGYKMVRTVI